jgi:D-glycero-alpha-D-manno-heptose-7-phosphate kinase
MKKITTQAPCRIDLAGGTLDLWPLYLYTGGHQLVHMAINIQATSQLTWKEHKKNSLEFSIVSKDLKTEKNYSSLQELSESLKKSPQQEPTRWLNRLVLHAFAKKNKTNLRGHLQVVCSSDAPPGSGLGGSSVMGVSLSRSLEKMFLPKNKQKKMWPLQEEVRNLEAIEIEHPAGEQDYVPALAGGLLIFEMDVDYKRTIQLSPVLAKKLSQHLVLVYTGRPHHSGLNNWEIFQNFHNNSTATREALLSIHKTSSEMAEELKSNSLVAMAELINREWEARMRLAKSVNAPELDQVWKLAQSQGASARKACGAGGGGCLLLYFENPKEAQNFSKTAASNSQWKILSTNVCLKGAI